MRDGSEIVYIRVAKRRSSKMASSAAAKWWALWVLKCIGQGWRSVSIIRQERTLSRWRFLPRLFARPPLHALPCSFSRNKYDSLQVWEPWTWQQRYHRIEGAISRWCLGCYLSGVLWFQITVNLSYQVSLPPLGGFRVPKLRDRWKIISYNTPNRLFLVTVYFHQ